MKRKLILVGILLILFSFFVYAKISSSSLNWLTKGEALTLFAPIEGSQNFKVYFNHSIYNTITFNLTESDADTIQTYTAPGEKFIFGDKFE